MAELSSEQQSVLTYVEEGGHVFVYGKAGTGKSFLIEQLVEKMSLIKTIQVCATTGIASQLLSVDGACTLDSFLQISPRIHQLEDYIKGMTYDRLPIFDILVVDEVSMLHPSRFVLMYEIGCLRFFPNAFAAMKSGHSRSYQEYRKAIYALPHPGIQFVLLGDFYQIMYVEKTDAFHYLFTTPLWRFLNIKVVLLTHIFRQTDIAFKRVLDKIRFNQIDKETIALLNRARRREPHKDAVHLFSLRADVEQFNASKLAKLPGVSRYFKARDTMLPGYEHYARDFRCESSVELKIGAKVMLLQNMKRVGLVNGSMGYVLQLSPLIVQFDGVKLAILPIKDEVYIKMGSKKKRIGVRLQIPLKCCFALTIHKAQGQTLPHVCVHLNGLFQTGLLYTALSRATQEEGLCLSTDSKEIPIYASMPELSEFTIKLKPAMSNLKTNP